MKWIVALVLASLGVGCSLQPGLERDPLVQVRSHVAFTEDDLKTPRTPLRSSEFQLAFSLIGGDFFGAPTTEDFVRPRVSEDLKLSVDFNDYRSQIEQAITTGSVAEGRVRVDPSTTRFGRVATFTMDPSLRRRAGYTAWADDGDARGLMLVYFDRPCTVVGSFTEEGHTYRYNVVIRRAGFAWLGRMPISEVVSETRVVARPLNLRLAVMPLDEIP